jgi:ribose transport system ATP-binding protein
MKILSGVYTADAGEIRFQGQRVAPASPQEALSLGIAIVHQELSLVPALTVGENIYPGRLPTNALGMVRFGELFRRSAEALAKLDVHVDPRTLVSRLSVATQQLVEITKALTSECKVLILDEPTSALTEREAETLFALLRRLAADGVGILYISHKLSEIFALADRVTVLRDGKYIGTENIQDITPDVVIRMMVGRELGEMYPDKAGERGEPVLEVRNLRLPGENVRNSFTLYKGEILGFAGLIGSGRSELVRAIFGADPRAEGEIVLDGQRIEIHSPGQAIQRRIGYLPEDRKAAGLFLDMAIKNNIEVSILPNVSKNGFIVPTQEKRIAHEYVRRLNINTPNVEQQIRRLSGGNQQKALVAKWLAIKPRLLIVDEPTRGIDVGAKREIHYLLRQLAQEGVGIVMVSSELPEILGMSDRVLVMHEGAIVAELNADQATEETIMTYASGQHNEVSV